ncbi:MAG: hypothetical protein HF308_20255, partial [Ignavibacteria bacterium]|nr:hypothetical protein [Ignavibacteria bacterium]
MTTTEELILNTSGDFINSSDGIHDVVFNRLNSWHTNGGRRRYYDAEEFKKANFNEAPLIFANTHPINIGKLPLEEALKEVDGRLIGTPQDVLVTNTNSALVGKISVTDDDVNELLKKGLCHISTAFVATPDEHGRYFNIVPNHILVYPIATGIDPGDQSALILNQSDEGQSDTMTEQKNDQLDLMRELVQNQTAKDELQAKVTEQSETIFNQKSQIDDLNKTVAQKDTLLSQKEEVITNQANAIESLNGKVSELTQKISDIKIAEKNARRERIFNQYSAGTKTKFLPRKEELFDDEKYEELIFEMNQDQSGIVKPPSEPSGTQEVAANQSSDKLEYINGVVIKYD